jgi:hypothetical protein
VTPPPIAAAPVDRVHEASAKESLLKETASKETGAEPRVDDIAVERDEDTAHHLVMRDAAETAPTLFDEGEEESAADLALEDAAVAADHSTRWKVDPARASNEPVSISHAASRARPAGQEERAFSSVLGDDVPPAPVERPRPAMLPVAFGVILGLLIGFAIGYALGGRESATSSTTVAETPAAGPAATAGQQPRQPGKVFSEQTVAPPAAAAPTGTAPAPTKTEAPPVPGDAPPAAAPSRASTPEPVATTARLTVLSTPSRAGVTVNGKWRGRTPLTLDALPFGKYTVRVVQPGFAASNEDVALTKGQPMRTVSVRLQAVNPRAASPAPSTSAARSTPTVRPTPSRASASPGYAGTIFVDSRPRGATVLIDGKAVGTTPASIPDIPIGSHVVRLELADHRAWTTSTRVTAGEQTRVTGSLELIR